MRITHIKQSDGEYVCALVPETTGEKRHVQCLHEGEEIEIPMQKRRSERSKG